MPPAYDEALAIRHHPSVYHLPTFIATCNTVVCRYALGFLAHIVRDNIRISTYYLNLLFVTDDFCSFIRNNAENEK